MIKLMPNLTKFINVKLVTTNSQQATGSGNQQLATGHPQNKISYTKY